MIDFHPQLINALKTVGLPLHYEMVVNSNTKVPCITYLELSDSIRTQSDVTDISNISYQVKVWANSIKEIQTYAPQVDRVMRDLGFSRTGAAELFDTNSTMIQKVFTYEGINLEKY